MNLYVNYGILILLHIGGRHLMAIEFKTDSKESGNLSITYINFIKEKYDIFKTYLNICSCYFAHHYIKEVCICNAHAELFNFYQS